MSSRRSARGNSRRATHKCTHSARVTTRRSQSKENEKETSAIKETFEQAGITTWNEDAMKNNAMALSAYRSEKRPHEEQLIPPARIGSIMSGGVSGFGFQHSIRSDPILHSTSAGLPALLQDRKEVGYSPCITPGSMPWWQRKHHHSGRGGSSFLKRTVDSEMKKTRKSPPTPVPRGAALNVAVLQNDGIGTALEEFARTRPDLDGESEQKVQRELLSTVLKEQDSKEVPREVLLGPEFANLDREETLDRLMNEKLMLQYGGNYQKLLDHLRGDIFRVRVGGSTQMRAAIRPPIVYRPPPNHPDCMDGAATARRKHETALSRLYGPSSGRLHVLPDGPSTWNRRDGIRCGIADIQVCNVSLLVTLNIRVSPASFAITPFFMSNTRYTFTELHELLALFTKCGFWRPLDNALGAARLLWLAHII